MVCVPNTTIDRYVSFECFVHLSRNLPRESKATGGKLTCQDG